MTTPEGKVKAKVRAVLDRPEIWSFWPVPSGYQAATLDVLCCIKTPFERLTGTYGVEFFAIEVKRPDGKGRKAARQKDLIQTLRMLSAKIFVIENDLGVEELNQWIKQKLN